MQPRCPRCGHCIPNDTQPGAYPGALSRWDDRTEVCSHCGAEEGIAQWVARNSGRDPLRAVHPTAGARPWHHPPKEAQAR